MDSLNEWWLYALPLFPVSADGQITCSLFVLGAEINSTSKKINSINSLTFQTTSITSIHETIRLFLSHMMTRPVYVSALVVISFSVHTSYFIVGLVHEIDWALHCDPFQVCSFYRYCPQVFRGPVLFLLSSFQLLHFVTSLLRSFFKMAQMITNGLVKEMLRPGMGYPVRQGDTVTVECTGWVW